MTVSKRAQEFENRTKLGKIARGVSFAAMAAFVTACSSTGSNVETRLITNPTPPALATAPSAKNLVLNQEARAFLIDATKPIIKAAGLDLDVEVNNMTQQQIEKVEGTSFNRLKPRFNIIIVDDPGINASVREDGTYNIYLNKDLLLQAKTPEAIQGVIAHELAHIIAKDIRGLKGRIKDARTRNAVANVAAIGVSIIGSVLDPDNASRYSNIASIGSKIASASEVQGLTNFVYTREVAADAYAIGLMKKANIRLNGTINLFKCMQYLQGTNPNTRVRGTHPVLTQRTTTWQKANNYNGWASSPQLVAKFDTMQASLGGPDYKPALCGPIGNNVKHKSITEQLDEQRAIKQPKLKH